MSDATLLAKLEEAEHRAEQKTAELERAREQLRGVFDALPVEFCVTFTGDYAAYTRAIVEHLRKASIVPAPMAYKLVREGNTELGDLCWNADDRAWHHVHGPGRRIGEYHAVIRKIQC